MPRKRKATRRAAVIDDRTRFARLVREAEENAQKGRCHVALTRFREAAVKAGRIDEAAGREHRSLRIDLRNAQSAILASCVRR